MGMFDFLRGKQSDEIPGGHGEFGHDITNPIPTKGLYDSYMYIEMLRTDDGLKPASSRLGSTTAPNMPGPIDIWQIFKEGGDQIATLHICAYHTRTSRKAPKGFVLVQAPASN